MPVILARVEGVRHPEVEAELARQWPGYTEWIIDPRQVYEYATYIREEWRGESDLVLVEHDVIPPPGAIAGLMDCEGRWCAHAVSLGQHISYRTLSLVKFSAYLQTLMPSLMAMALPGPGSGQRQVHWRSVDSAVTRALDFARVPLHQHPGIATHLHYPEIQER